MSHIQYSPEGSNFNLYSLEITSDASLIGDVDLIVLLFREVLISYMHVHMHTLISSDFLTIQGSNLPFLSLYDLLAYFCFHQRLAVSPCMPVLISVIHPLHEHVTAESLSALNMSCVLFLV